MYSCGVIISETATERSYRIMPTIFGEWKLVIMDERYADNR
jgi:hypothetical protein